MSVFLPFVDPPGSPEGAALVISVKDRDVSVDDGPAPEGGIFLGTLDGRHCWAVEIDAAPPASGGAGQGAGAAGQGAGGAPGVETSDPFFVDLRRLWGMVDETVWTLAGRAVQLVDWARTHRYCGRCGTATEAAPGERAMRCPSCGLTAFPRLAPAIIVLIERDDGRALLARNVRFPTAMYSCLAGFVEPGETLEEAVRREVKEEVGVDLADVSYWGSQPWPFPHSLMLGFQAHYGGGEIVCDGSEIAEARWFARDELPMVPPRMSIAGRLIEDWVQRG